MKSNNYDFTPNLLVSLGQSVTTENTLLKKSKDNDELHVHISDVVQVHKQAEAICNQINKAFAELKTDFTNGAINQARYKGYLQPYKDFFESEIIKSQDMPSSLNTVEILQEVEHYFGAIYTDLLQTLNKKQTAIATPVKTTIKKSIASNTLRKSATATEVTIKKQVEEIERMAEQVKNKRK